MNNCILMAEITQDPQIRYTSDNQTPLAEMQVQIAGLRPEDPPETLKVVGWGNLAQEIQEKYHTGDRVIIEGRLGMNTVERPEGFKEKRAELTINRIHRLEGGELSTNSSAPPAADSAPAKSRPAAAAQQPAPNRAPAAAKAKAAPAAATPAPDYDDIPF
ncbi:single-stranded DNA-binding protein [Microcoleus sp. FACHB-1515]|uniref:single-stranded DNA-binding protein n=1 Tax=Cyanophyceae TaxID=3028117 RepID=UPI001681C62E|nr:single-stranded DNA-binding protein [Microcoleus sp. FACHB-1515]MBD2091247.1 single-stranded DNA-binding protein [Microcoleus sp. FACHB-1515]